jgi:predicted ATPase
MGDFETAYQYAMRGVQTWRSGNVQTHAEDYITPVVACLCYGAMCEWHFGELTSCRKAIAEAISIAKEVKDMNSVALALAWAAALAHCERNPTEVDRLTSELVELSTRQNFAYWLAIGAIWRGWARSASGNTAEGIPSIELGIRDHRATGAVLALPTFLALKAEALHLADRTSEALEAINEAEALAERFDQLYYRAELHRLRGVFLAALGGEKTDIEASFCKAIRIAKEQKSISLEKHARATYAEYARQKASGSGGSGLRLSVW